LRKSEDALGKKVELKRNTSRKEGDRRSRRAMRSEMGERKKKIDERGGSKIRGTREESAGLGSVGDVEIGEAEKDP